MSICRLSIYIYIYDCEGPPPTWAPKGGPHGHPRCRASRALTATLDDHIFPAKISKNIATTEETARDFVF